MERPGGIISQLKQFIDATIEVSQSDDLDLPATGPTCRRRSRSRSIEERRA